jgi:hypothetical protein
LHFNLLAQRFLCFFAVEKRFLEKMPRTCTTGGIGFGLALIDLQPFSFQIHMMIISTSATQYSNSNHMRNCNKRDFLQNFFRVVSMAFIEPIVFYFQREEQAKTQYCNYHYYYSVVPMETAEERPATRLGLCRGGFQN